LEINEFKKDFIENVKTIAASDGSGTTKAYTDSMASYLIDAEVLPDFTPAYYSGIGQRNRKIRIDGFNFDKFDETLNIIVSDYNSDLTKTLIKSEAENIFARSIRFVEEIYFNNLASKIEISTEASDLAEILTTNRNKIRKFKIYLFTDGEISERIKSFDLPNCDQKTVEGQIWDLNRLHKVIIADSGKENVEVNFLDYTPKGIPSILANVATQNEYKSYLCVIPASVIADIYDKHGAMLLEGNVRSFLSTKVAVNKKIRATILNEPEMFFAFNNGISATAQKIEIQNNEDGLKIINAIDFQIINGGQTTASLSNARYKDKAELKDIFVQMKITEINTDLDSTHDLMQKISRSSNSQNKVSDADFFSTHPFHIRIENLSRRIFAPAVGGVQYDTHWFYERTRGQYLQAQMRKTVSEQKKFLIQNPKSQLINKTDFAKALNTFRKQPNIVSKGAQTNFMEFAKWVDNQWGKNESLFNDKFFRDAIAKYILFKKTEKLVSNQSWYEQGYRANIVTYSLSYLIYAIEKEFPNRRLDYHQIWIKQDMTDVLAKELSEIARNVMLKITSDTRPTINVTQWCKQELCWQEMKKIAHRFSPNFEKALVSLAVEKNAEKDAKDERKIDKEIEAQTIVVEKGSEYWKSFLIFCDQKKIATPGELESIKIACKIPQKLPNSIHSQKILSLLDKALLEGWKN